MQLDKTEIVVRQRNALELLDLSILVMRRHFRSIVMTSAVFGIPFLLLNALATYWMLSEDAYLAAEHLDSPESYMHWRHTFHTVALYALEFPLISLPTTIFLGNQIFYYPISLREILARIRPIWFRIVWVLGVFRLSLLGPLFAFFINRDLAWDWLVEFWLIIVLGAAALFARACWPFAPEIIGLELCPLRKKKENEITYAQRNRGLHRLLVADHIARFVGAAAFAGMLVLMFVALGLFAKGVSIGSWVWNDWYNYLVLPIVLWCVGMFVSVYRFLSYLDSRIRLEGWEIELRLKAEASRLRRGELVPTIQPGDLAQAEVAQS